MGPWKLVQTAPSQQVFIPLAQLPPIGVHSSVEQYSAGRQTRGESRKLAQQPVGHSPFAPQALRQRVVPASRVTQLVPAQHGVPPVSEHAVSSSHSGPVPLVPAGPPPVFPPPTLAPPSAALDPELPAGPPAVPPPAPLDEPAAAPGAPPLCVPLPPIAAPAVPPPWSLGRASSSSLQPTSSTPTVAPIATNLGFPPLPAPAMTRVEQRIRCGASCRRWK
jgi:hypothetical protein